MSPNTKRLFCLLLLCIVILSLTACGGKSKNGGVRCVDGKYYDDTVDPNAPLPDDQVTLDIIARNIYNEYFAALDDGEPKKAVISEYLKYHIPDNGVEHSLVDMILSLKILDEDSPWDGVATIENIQQTLSEGGAAISYVKLYATLRDNPKAIGDIELIENLYSNCSEVADYFLKASKSVFLISELSRCDVSDPETYATTVVSTIRSLTDFIPYMGDYFNEGLTVVEEGIEILIEQYGDYMLWIESHGTETDGVAGICTKKNWDILTKPQYWNDTDKDCNIENSGCHSLSLREINNAYHDLTHLSADEENVLIAYILFRLPYEMVHPTLQDPPKETNPNADSACAHSFEKSTRDSKEPTCTEAGSYIYKCNRKCGEGYIKTIPALGHDYQDTVIAPTFESEGYTLHTCSVCGFTKEDTYVAPLSLPDLTQCSAWYGYKIDPPFYPIRLDITINALTPDEISGHLTTSQLLETEYETAFTGIGKLIDDHLEYTLTLETPQDLGWGLVCSSLTLYYDFATEQFYLDGEYHGDLFCATHEKPPALFENVTWFGTGEPSFDHRVGEAQFTLQISSMSTAEISGYYTQSRKGGVYHESAFTGRAVQKGNTIYYEILFSNPNTTDSDEDPVIGLFLEYDLEKDIFVINDVRSIYLNRQ